MIRFQSKDAVLNLPNPQLGDSLEPRLGVTRHFDMAGRQHTFKDSITSSLLVLNFIALSQATVLAARAFFLKTSGQQITYVSPIGRVWTGLVTNSPGFTSRGICNSEITVEFEGN